MRRYSNYARDNLKILYYMTDICNFHCDYCYRFPYKKKSYEPTKEDIDNLVANLKSNSFKIYDFKIIGGEPCINNKTLYLIDKIQTLDIHNNIIVASNGSNKIFFENLKSYDLSKIKLHLTYHPQYDNIINNFDWFINNFDNVEISCILDKRYKDKVFNFIDRYKDYKNILYIKIVNNPELLTDSLYNTKFSDMNFLKSIGERINIPFTDFLFSYKVDDMYKNRKCFNNILKIEPSGALSYSGCHRKFKIETNIYKNVYKHQEYPIICNKDRMYGDCSNCLINYHE